MWTKLIEVVIQWCVQWHKAKPRQDAINDVVALYDSMENCHRQFLAHRHAKGTKVQEEAHAEWKKAIDDLYDSVWDITRLLGAFSREAFEQVNHYYDVEYLAMSISQRMPKDAEQLATMPVAPQTGEVPSPHADGQFHLDSGEGFFDTYETAMRSLSAFINANFTVEEIHAAQKARRK